MAIGTQAGATLRYRRRNKNPPLTLTPKDMGWVTMWLSFLSGVNGRASCMLSYYLTKTVYLFVDTFTLHGLFSAGFHNTNMRVNVKDSVVHGPEWVLVITHLRKGYVKANSLDSNRERVAFTVFSVDLISVIGEK